MLNERRISRCDRTGAVALGAVSIIAAVDLIRMICLGSLIPFVTVLLVEALFLLTAGAAWKGRMPWFLLLITVGGAVLYGNLTYAELAPFYLGFLLQAVAAGALAVLGTVFQIRDRTPVGPFPWRPILAGLVIAGVSVGTWRVAVARARSAEGLARREIWAVPERYDGDTGAPAGSVEELIYSTKAYATDGREVEKRALVYLPAGYDPAQPYNILYLMHGTGDDENYWLETHPSNRLMLDNLIAAGQIDPLIVVTPTFYVEDDCADDLDQLTWSFREELRNDLMPAVESRWSTYAESCDPAGFAASRDHRAFAGLSRGAVTTYHSVFCGSMDYFSWFGTFSGSRTGEEEFREGLQAAEVASLPIHYLYVSGGNFDFALVGQLQDYDTLLRMEPRLVYGVNTLFDIFPMRYHSIGSWHLALYNFLQKIF